MSRDGSFDADSLANELGARLSCQKGMTKGVENKYPERIYANSHLRLDKIEFYGFDMDYTLAMYKSPEMETLIFDLIKKRLVNAGYPSEFLNFKYDESFPVRGVCYDISHGNFLKVDSYGHILLATHGTRLLELCEIDSYYMNRHIDLNGSEIVILSTVYCQSVICILSMLIDYYTAMGTPTERKNGIYVDDGKYIIFYWDIYLVVVQVKDYVHENELKDATLADIPRYLDKDPLIGEMIDRIREPGRKTFLLTNSKYKYVERIMSYLLDGNGRTWRDFFDYIIIDANKPTFFTSKCHHFLLVSEETKLTFLRSELNELKTGKIYSGGCASEFCRLTKAKTKSVIYVGDSIYGDILKSKKNSWKTLLIIPGLKKEIHHWWRNYKSYKMLDVLDQIQKNELYAYGENRHVVNWVSSVYKCLSRMIDSRYGTLGSPFRSGSLHCYFFDQVQKYADLYSHSVTTLNYYLPSYSFHCKQIMLPHEKLTDDLFRNQMANPEGNDEDYIELAREMVTTYINDANRHNIEFRQKTLDSLKSSLDSISSDSDQE